MSARTDFKNALQKLTTTLVKAELAQDEGDAALAELRTTSLEQWKRVRTTHAALVAELGTEAPLPHQGWYEQSIARAEKLFGKLPAEE